MKAPLSSFKMIYQTHLYHFYELSYSDFRKPYFTIRNDGDAGSLTPSSLGSSPHGAGYAVDGHPNVLHQEFIECQKLHSGMFR